MKWPDDFIGKVIQGDCIDVMRQMPDKCVDLVVTSPPYDGLRDYNGYSFPFEKIAHELFRVVADGGVCVWVVGDSVVDGSESGTSSRQSLRFKEIGFRLHDTMIYEKDSSPFPETNRYNQAFEYMFILSKDAPKTFNPIREKCREWRTPSKTTTQRNKDGSLEPFKYETGKEFKNKSNVWKYGCGYMKSSKDKSAFQHPATFPEKLAADHIVSWSNAGDIVFDPFLGSGTTAILSERNDRRWLGSDLSEKYCAIARKRIAAEQSQGKLFQPTKGE